MTQSLRVVSLENARNAIPVIAQWFCYQWPDWYGNSGPGDALADLASWAENGGLPLACVALTGQGEPMGIAALKETGQGAEHGVGPFLSAFYVPPAYRRQGIGLSLIHAIEEAARDLSLPAIYAATDGARSLLQKAGWREMGLTSFSERGELHLLQMDLS
nr:GNAT family N-acetyltransferase [uncultured Cohaesibacter sp.]